jgi:glutathione peroxidase-family protein
VLLGFPCNQFGAQDPGSNDEISSFCQVNYGVTFPPRFGSAAGKVTVGEAFDDPLEEFQEYL